MGEVWLYVIQIISSVGILSEGVVVFVVLCQATGRIVIESQKLTKWLMTGHLIAGTQNLATLMQRVYTCAYFYAAA